MKPSTGTAGLEGEPRVRRGEEEDRGAEQLQQRVERRPVSGARPGGTTGALCTAGRVSEPVAALPYSVVARLMGVTCPEELYFYTTCNSVSALIHHF